MTHARFLRIDLKHSYYENGWCGDFAVMPTEDTNRKLRNHRCVAKYRSHGVDLFTETDAAGIPKIGFGSNAALSFELHLRNPDFPFFTDSFPLTGADSVTIGYPEGPGTGYFALVDIQREFDLPDESIVEIAFQAKPVFWVFYLVTDLSGTASDFAIECSGTPGFSWISREGTDPLAEQLGAQYPQGRVLRFISARVLSCREQPVRNIRLLWRGNTFIESLPNPNWRNYSRMEMEPNEGPVDGIYHIVKCLTKTTLTKV